MKTWEEVQRKAKNLKDIDNAFKELCRPGKMMIVYARSNKGFHIIRFNPNEIGGPDEELALFPDIDHTYNFIVNHLETTDDGFDW